MGAKQTVPAIEEEISLPVQAAAQVQDGGEEATRPVAASGLLSLPQGLLIGLTEFLGTLERLDLGNVSTRFASIMHHPSAWRRLVLVYTDKMLSDDVSITTFAEHIANFLGQPRFSQATEVSIEGPFVHAGTSKLYEPVYVLLKNVRSIERLNLLDVPLMTSDCLWHFATSGPCLLYEGLRHLALDVVSDAYLPLLLDACPQLLSLHIMAFKGGRKNARHWPGDAGLIEAFAAPDTDPNNPDNPSNPNSAGGCETARRGQSLTALSLRNKSKVTHEGIRAVLSLPKLRWLEVLECPRFDISSLKQLGPALSRLEHLAIGGDGTRRGGLGKSARATLSGLTSIRSLWLGGISLPPLKREALLTALNDMTGRDFAICELYACGIVVGGGSGSGSESTATTQPEGVSGLDGASSGSGSEPHARFPGGDTYCLQVESVLLGGNDETTSATAGAEASEQEEGRCRPVSELLAPTAHVRTSGSSSSDNGAAMADDSSVIVRMVVAAEADPAGVHSWACRRVSRYVPFSGAERWLGR